MTGCGLAVCFSAGACAYCRALLAVVVAVSVAVTVEFFGRDDDCGGDLVIGPQVEQAHALRGDVEVNPGALFAGGLPQVITCLQIVPEAGIGRSASDRRSDMSADIPAEPFRMRESVVRETCKRLSWSSISPRYSRNTLPG